MFEHPRVQHETKQWMLYIKPVITNDDSSSEQVLSI